MKNLSSFLTGFLRFSFPVLLLFISANISGQVLPPDTGRIKNIKIKHRYDNPDLAFEFEIEKTKSPVTNKVPRQVLAEANRRAKESKEFVLSGRNTSSLVWEERGSYTDAVGVSNGNTRSNGAVTSGRMRAIWVDLSDPTGNTVWVGGVDGGLWKTTNISSASASWSIINDFLSNLAVTGITQDPTNPSIMYFCTGEAFNNADAVNGNGVYKSTDGGVTWNQVSATAGLTKCTKILCDAAGNVYLSTVGSGLRRSNNGGSTWTTITPSGLTSNVPDFEISSTGRLHISCGLGSTSAAGYRYTDAPATVTSSGWTAAATPFVFPATSGVRAELACVGNVLYAAISNANSIVQEVSKSTDGGVTWSTTTLSSTAITALNGGGTSSQAWYCLTVGIDPSNTNNAMIGNLNIIKTSDGGATWIKGSEWVGLSGQYVHADQHAIVWYDNGNKLLFGTDGGVHFSSDKGATIRDRNTGLRIKQFYSVSIHPTLTNYFLAGTQDNGTHQFNSPGIAASVEVTGGDGGFTAIDQNQPSYQFGTYVYNAYRRSTNGGANWGSVNFYKGTSTSASNFGRFINPFDYDNANNIIYAAAGSGEIFRWTTPQTTSTGSYYLDTGFPTGATILTGITNMSAQVSAIKVSPYTPNRVYFGGSSGRLIYIDNAHTAASSTPGVNIRSTSFSGIISSIELGTSDQNIMVCFSNYDVNNVWVTTNGGSTWTAIDGNLPNMPVRWGMFMPGSNTKAILATETGIWETDLINGSSTIWTANPTFPVVRTDMLKYRSSDGTLIAATHGRGLFTTVIEQCPTTPDINISASAPVYCSPSGSPVTLTASGAVSYTWTPPTGLSSTSGASVNASPSANTTYTVTGYDANGCSGTAALLLTVAPSFTVTATATPSPICNSASSVLNATVNSGTISYCNTTYTSGTGSGDFIAQVSIDGTTLNNITTGAASPYYTLYPASGSTTASLAANTLYTMRVKGGTFSTCYIRGWIDYNNDGTFTASESIGMSGNVGGSATGTFTFTVPSSAINGNIRLRMRSSDSSPGVGTEDFCLSTNSNWGETEDYEITITGGLAPYTYLWSPTNFLSALNTATVNANSVTATTNYNVLVTSIPGCSANAIVALTVSNVQNASGISASRCGTGTVNISASSTGNVIDWYSASAGGTLLATASNTFTTPSISVTTTYYALARNATTGCLSPGRTAVTATVNPVPANASGTNGSRCGTGTVAISAASSGNVIDWYAAASGGVALATNTNSFTTPSISVTTNYYAQARNATTGCISASRTLVTATVNNTAIPGGTDGSRCGTGTVNISAASSGNVIDWYAASSGGSALATGSNTFTTPSISTTTIYYAQARNASTGCVSSSRTAVTATVNSNPATPLITANGPTTFCNGGNVTLTSSSAVNNLWSTGATTQSIIVNSTGNYTVTVTGAGGCSSTSLVTAVTVNACSVVLNLKLFLEGYYVSNSTMRSTLYDLGLSGNAMASDSITVNLWSPADLANPVPAYSEKVVILNNGNAVVNVPPAMNGRSFYIAVKHRNHLETWSADSVLMSASTSYDFSNAFTKAFGDGFNMPMKNMGNNVFALYGGDINSDGTVDGLDQISLVNDAVQFAFGYNASDITGDGASDALDQIIVVNNSSAFLFYARPYSQRTLLRRIFSKFKR